MPVASGLKLHQRRVDKRAMRKPTTICVALGLLSGAVGCGTAHVTTGPLGYTPQEEKAREEKQTIELAGGAQYLKEHAAVESKRTAEGLPPNENAALAKARQVETEEIKEGVKPEHSSGWYLQVATEQGREDERSKDEAQCREKYGAEAKVTSWTSPEADQIYHGRCTGPNGEHEGF